MKLPLLTNSRIKTYRSCQRKHKLRYVDGYRAVRSNENQRFGSLIHAGLEAFFKAYRSPERLDLALAALAIEPDAFERAKAEALLVGYDARWGDEQYEVLSVEQQFETSLVNPHTGAESKTWREAGKLDVMLRDLRDGRTLLTEHKTSSEDIRQGSDYWRRLRMDSQVSIYFDGALALGHEVAGCLYDVICKPGLRPLKATPIELRKYTKATKTEPSRLYSNQRETDETPAEYRARIAAAICEDPTAFYQRAEVSRLEAELDAARQDTWQLGQQMREAERMGRAPRNPDACLLYGSYCEFFDVCSGQASLEDPMRFAREADVHPELAPAA